MILVDTSVLIDFLKGNDNEFVEKFTNIINQKIPFGICNYIYQELLQGARNENEFNKLKDYFSTQIFYDLKNGVKSFEDAANIYFICRKNGVTPRSTIDLLIIQIAIENNLLLLHNDNDFSNIAKIITDIRIY